jgi:hypothetical protein
MCTVKLNKMNHKSFQFRSQHDVDIHFLSMGWDNRGLIGGFSEYHVAKLPT